uniref:Uncharacterized protein n=1 Tax=Anguilla anguilla TaxID=7936 RepID=A0A0E9V1I7_ANGAN
MQAVIISATPRRCVLYALT